MFASCVPVDHFLDRVLIVPTIINSSPLKHGPTLTSHRRLCLDQFSVDKLDVSSDRDQMGMLHKGPHYAENIRAIMNFEVAAR